MLVHKDCIVVVSGGFDPVHSGHILLLNSAKTYGNYLIVGVNSDEWLARKKGRAFLPWEERAAVIRNMKPVDEVMSFDDSDGTACNLLEKVKAYYPGFPIIFANGGDRNATNIPELEVKDILFKFGIGGDYKANSSSWITEDWKHPKTMRPWGYYRVLHEAPGYKVKELVIEPGKMLSMQRHFKREEHWYVLSGMVSIHTKYLGTNQMVMIRANDSHNIGKEVWHQGQNNTKTAVHILEVQYGTECIEEDIERK